MQNLTITELSSPEFRQIFREELRHFFENNPINPIKTNAPDGDEIGGVELAMEVTGLAKATIYGHASARTIPHAKRGGKLYFSRKKLTEWIKSGNRKTSDELKADASAW